MKNKIKTLLLKLNYCTKPNFIIVGAEKAGTTALHSILEQHSKIVSGRIKEIHYFDNHKWYLKKRIHEYHSYFPLPHQIDRGTLTFEATPNYLYLPDIPKRLYDYNPNLKLIISLRDPALRALSAWSMYHHNFKAGSQTHLNDPRSFSKAVSDELEFIDQENKSYDHIEYIRRGIYHFQIEAYLNYFPSNQILVLENTELINLSDSTSNKIQSFLGLPIEQLKSTQKAVSKFNHSNEYTNEIKNLYKFYKPFNKKLFKLLGKEYNWNI